MQPLYSKRRLFLLTVILIVSNLVITGITLSVIYNKSISSSKKTLIETVERQKSLINTLHREGKGDTEILAFLKRVHEEEYYAVGSGGQFVISQLIGDSVIFLFSDTKQTNFQINDPNRMGLPTYLSLQGSTSSIIIRGFDGVKIMAAYTFIPTLQWGLIARQPISEISTPFYWAMLIAIFVSILIITICVFLFVRIFDPIVREVFKSEKVFRDLFENMLNGYTYCKIIPSKDGIDFIYLNVNKSFERLTGLKNVAGRKISEVLPRIQKTDKILLEVFAKVSQTGNPEVFEWYIESLQIWFNISVYSTEENYFIALFDRISERKLAESQLQEKNEEYEQINEELKQTNEQLFEAKAYAENSDRLKTAFIQNMSHEIRTPMNAIMGFSSLLSENFEDKEKLDQFSQIIYQRCNDLLHIIDDILDISKIESGRIPINIQECNLTSLFSEVSTFFKESKRTFGKQHVEFNVQVHDEAIDAVILTDQAKLKQILINLIGNAFKYTEKGFILVGCKLETNHTVLFYVSDTGIGIPSDKHDFIFERFGRIEQTPDHFYGGTGLGLSIVKGLIDLLDGKIWLESELGKGTTFYFSLPTTKISNIPIEHFLIDEKPEIYDFSNKTILIVEDDVHSTDYLKEILSGLGINILQTFYGYESIQISKSQKLDLILMDIRLPDMDGYTATKMIRKFQPDLKIIAQTAYAAQIDKEMAIRSGCNDFISKPINREVLLTMIKTQLSKN